VASAADPKAERVGSKAGSDLSPPRARNAPDRGSRISHWTRFEQRWLLSLATILALLATAIMLFEAFNRGFMARSFFWAEEGVRYLMIWAFFLTIGAAGRGGYHIRTEMLVDMLPAGLRRACNLLASLAGVGFSIVLFTASLPQVYRYYTMGMMTESNLDLPMWLLFMAMPIGALLMGGYYVGCLIRAYGGAEPFGAQPVPGAPPLAPNETQALEDRT